MEIVPFPHPALRWKSREIREIDERLRGLVQEMFELMYSAEGIGLAANQVGLPYRVFVANLQGNRDEPDEEAVFINPVITNRRGLKAAEEGCLSLPGLFAEVRRPEQIVVEAYGLDGQPFRLKLDDLAARVVQHETDHLDGVLFIDRLEEELKRDFESKVAQFETEFRKRQTAGEVAADAALLTELERLHAMP